MSSPRGINNSRAPQNAFFWYAFFFAAAAAQRPRYPPSVTHRCDEHRMFLSVCVYFQLPCESLEAAIWEKVISLPRAICWKIPRLLLIRWNALGFCIYMLLQRRRPQPDGRRGSYCETIVWITLNAERHWDHDDCPFYMHRLSYMRETAWDQWLLPIKRSSLRFLKTKKWNQFWDNMIAIQIFERVVIYK